LFVLSAAKVAVPIRSKDNRLAIKQNAVGRDGLRQMRGQRHGDGQGAHRLGDLKKVSL
jgi:hypothetical protein